MAGRSTARALVWCALAGQLLFAAAWIVAGALEPSYSNVSQPVSALSARDAAHPWIVIAGLALSGLTAFPLRHELEAVCSIRGLDQPKATPAHSVDRWLLTIRDGLRTTYANYPWVAYGTDWLAFAHLVIAVAFVGVLRNPVRNIWVVEFGMIACAMVIPLALIAGQVREIPIGWRLIDCSFGVFGIVPLWSCRREIKRLAYETAGLEAARAERRALP